MSGPDRSSPRQRPASFTTSSGERAPCTPTCVCARPDTPPRWLLVARGPLNTPWTWWWPGGSSARACGAGAGRVRTTSSLFGHSPWTPRPGGPGGVMLPGELRTPASPSRLRVPGVDGRGEENYASRLFMTGKGETRLRGGIAPRSGRTRPSGQMFGGSIAGYGAPTRNAYHRGAVKRAADHLTRLQQSLAVRTIYVDLDGTLLGPGGSLFASPDGVVD